ncbi:hypothetical protein [Nocardia neocaledoniensis]|nr:hypothetical protein [Nocardia neocaledoniensis]
MMMTAWVTACCGWALWADATVFEDVNTSFSAGIALVIPVAVWLVLAAIGLARYARSWRLTLLVPLAVTSTIALTWADIPGRIGWAMSREAMDQAASVCEKFEASPAGQGPTEKRIGFYAFRTIDKRTDGGCRFTLARDYPVSRNGFHYRPGVENPEVGVGYMRYDSLGDWWYYYQWAE